MLLTAAGALKTRQSGKRVGSFGKQWQSGMTARVFYPIVREDGVESIVVHADYGHSVNPKTIPLKRVFIPTNSEVNESGRPVEPDVMYQFSQVSRLIFEGQKKEELDRLKNITDRDMYAEAKQTIIEDYKKKSPEMGGLRYVISTEAVFIPLNDAGKPLLEKARLVSQDLSDTRINVLLNLIEDPQFAITEDEKWLEVTYNFGSKGSRKEDGKVTPTGVTEDYKLKTQFPVEFATLKATLASLPEDSELIRKRNGSFRKLPETTILRGLANYAVRNAHYLDILEDDEDLLERLQRNADIIKKLEIPIQIKLQYDEPEKDINEDPNIDESAPTLGQLQKEQFDKEVEDIRASGDDTATSTFQETTEAVIQIPGI